MTETKQIKPELLYSLRKEVLRKQMTLSEKMQGDHHSNTLHFGLYLDKELVSIVSYIKSDHPELDGTQYQLRGMATAEHQQQKGFGKQLITNSIEQLKKMGVTVIWCNARVSALDFYTKQGFTIIGDEFNVPQVGPHFVMYKNLI